MIKRCKTEQKVVKREDEWLSNFNYPREERGPKEAINPLQKAPEHKEHPTVKRELKTGERLP